MNGRESPRSIDVGLVMAGLAIFLFAAWYVVTPRHRSGSGPSGTIANNLRILEGAKEQYALEYHLPPSAPVREADLLPYLKGQRMLQPVVGEIYGITNVGTLITATLTRGPVAGKAGPFTVTSF